jgi:hypothetical protein
MYDYNVRRALPDQAGVVTDKAKHWCEVVCGVRRLVLAVKKRFAREKSLGLNSRAALVCAATSAKVDTKVCHELAACSS